MNSPFQHHFTFPYFASKWIGSWLRLLRSASIFNLVINGGFGTLFVDINVRLGKKKKHKWVASCQCTPHCQGCFSNYCCFCKIASGWHGTWCLRRHLSAQASGHTTSCRALSSFFCHVLSVFVGFKVCQRLEITDNLQTLLIAKCGYHWVLSILRLLSRCST